MTKFHYIDEKKIISYFRLLLDAIEGVEEVKERKKFKVDHPIFREAIQLFLNYNFSSLHGLTGIGFVDSIKGLR